MMFGVGVILTRIAILFLFNTIAFSQGKARIAARLAGTLIIFALTLAAGQAQASPSDILKVVFTRSGASWSVDVTIRHADTGWKHYTNVWVVETLDGKELGRRVLFHPHETEQPFTRSDTVKIPAGISKVRVRAGDKPNGMSSNTVVIDLTKPKGERYIVR